MHVRAKDIAAWLRERVSAAGAQGLVVGLDGGIDSAVVLGLCAMAVPGHVVGAILPCRSDPQEETDARLVAGHFSVPAARVELDGTYDRLATELAAAVSQLQTSDTPAVTAGAPAAPMPLANIRPRLRMLAVYFIANSLRYLVAGTGNRCDLTIGCFTKHGEGAADLLPIGDLLEGDVRALARDIGVPAAVMDKARPVRPWSGQTDEADGTVSYPELERYLAEGPAGVPPALGLRIERRIRQTGHKRSPAPTPASDTSFTS